MDEAHIGTNVNQESQAEQQSDAELLRTVELHGAIYFPGLPIVDSSSFEAYKPDEDVLDVGRILYLLPEEVGEDTPYAMLIFRRDGFTFNTRNTPEPEEPYTVRNVGDSFFGPQGRRWRADEVDLAMIYGKIRMEGVDVESAEFQDQLVGWSESEQRFITMKEAMDNYQSYLKAKKKDKNLTYNFFNNLNQDSLNELVLSRLSVDGSLLTEGMIERFKSDPEFAASMIRTETTRMNANISMMADRRKLPPVALCEVDYLKLTPSQDPRDLDMLIED